MNFYERIELLCAEKGISADRLCKELGLSNATATKWRKGAEPRNATKKAVADYFGVNLEYVSGQTDIKEKPTNYGELSERKKDFIRKIENMSDSQLERLEQILSLVEQKEL